MTFTHEYDKDKQTLVIYGEGWTRLVLHVNSVTALILEKIIDDANSQEKAVAEFADLQARAAELEDFLIGVEETLELHPSFWLSHLTNDIAEVRRK